MTPPIVEVTQDEETGELHYRLRTSLLTTEEYGKLLVRLAGVIAAMLASEKPEIPGGQWYSEIIHFMIEAIEQPPPKEDVRMLN